MLGLSLISIIIIAIVFIFFFLAFKIIWKAILFTFIVLIIGMGILTYLVYTDVNKMINEEKTIIVVTEDELLTGLKFIDDLEQANYFTREEVNQYNQAYFSGEKRTILGDSYLLITIKTGMFDNLKENLTIQNESISKQEAIDLLKASDPDEFVQIASNLSQDVSNTDIVTENEMLEYKFQLSAALTQELINDAQAGGVKTAIKNIDFYPNRITIVLIKEMPHLVNKFLPK